MKLVLVESPFAGDVEVNTEYAKKCMRDCLLRGEAPYVSHLLYTQDGILDDEIPKERELGIDRAKKENRPVEYRRLFDE